ncbi:MAG: helix-hairpin-helix domain-containing protein [Deltaproteobacteria bacterium]
MKPLSLKTAPQRIDERAAGLLVLLLTLFLLHALKPAPYRHGAETVPCMSPVYAQIKGEVRHPGVYAFCASPTLDELVLRAGGLREGYLQPSSLRLTPDAGVSVTKQEGTLRVQPVEIPSFYKITLGLPISLNTETEEGLTALPGIGKNMARAIVEERTRRGGFKSMDEIMKIPGIGPKLYARMKPHLTL